MLPRMHPGAGPRGAPIRFLLFFKNASRRVHFLLYNEGLSSTTSSRYPPEMVTFRRSSAKVVMPSHVPREGDWLAVCLSHGLGVCMRCLISKCLPTPNLPSIVVGVIVGLRRHPPRNRHQDAFVPNFPTRGRIELAPPVAAGKALRRSSLGVRSSPRRHKKCHDKVPLNYLGTAAAPRHYPHSYALTPPHPPRTWRSSPSSRTTAGSPLRVAPPHPP
eukprot:COSAG02_NODE_682_length_18523_cov_28.592271_18_plen_217_part_00